MLEAHVLASGSDGNCCVIECDGEAVMIDCGLSCRRIMSLMDQAGVDSSMIKAILVTHEHGDHISGAQATARKLDVPIMTNLATFEASGFSNVKYVPVDPSKSFEVGSMKVTPLPTSHDAVDPHCYFTETDQGNVVIATDTGKMNFQIAHAISLSDIAIVESNYDIQMLRDGPYPLILQKRIRGEYGHMSNVDCARTLRDHMKPGATVFLAHLSKNNNLPDVARQTVSDISGIDRRKIDCMEFQCDIRTLKKRALPSHGAGLTTTAFSILTRASAMTFGMVITSSLDSS